MRIPRECKRLAEVDFPIAVVSKHAAREKSIRHGHPSTMHLWWARRPLASSRAMLLALLLPDPCDEHCPPDFKTQARILLAKVQGSPGPMDTDLRTSLLKFIGDFANWDLSANPRFLEVGQGLVRAAHGEEPPLVVDPFAGGGSIPLEALRLGCEAFASDLNPVACLILKVLLEDIPGHGPELAEGLRRAGKDIKEAAERELKEFYPPDPDGSRPIAYLWARTVSCETSGCGAEIPLAGSLWLSKKTNRRVALRHRILRHPGTPPKVEFEIIEPQSDGGVQHGVVSRAKATCPACKNPLEPARVRAQLSEQHGGSDVLFDAEGQRIGGARLLAVVILVSGKQGRQYRLPEDRDYEPIRAAMRKLDEVLAKSRSHGMSAVPDELLPPVGTLGFRVQRYGMRQWGDLFTARQKLTLTSLIGFVGNSQEIVADLACLSITRFSDDFSSLTRWMDRETPAATFSRPALPMLLDFCEVWPFDEASWSYSGSYDWVANAVESPPVPAKGQVQLADARRSPLPDESTAVWFTDPPYYDAIPYSDLSDFFLVWLKRGLPERALLRDPFDTSNQLSPKAGEIVQDDARKVDGRAKDRKFFEDAMAEAFAEGRRVLTEEGIASVVFAHKTTEGWEALLSVRPQISIAN